MQTDLVYHSTCNSLFHHWTVGSQRFGLSFRFQGHAKKFEQEVKRVVKDLVTQLTANGTVAIMSLSPSLCPISPPSLSHPLFPLIFLTSLCSPHLLSLPYASYFSLAQLPHLFSPIQTLRSRTMMLFSLRGVVPLLPTTRLE